MELFGSWPGLTSLALFYWSIVAFIVVVFNNNNSSGRFKSRSLLPHYIGPARQHGIGVIRVQIDRTARVVSTWRFIAAPNAEVDPTTLRVTPTRASTSDEATPQYGQSDIEDTDS